MYRHSNITLLIILFLGRHVLVSTMDQYVCFAKSNGWCDSNLVLCNETSVAYNLVDYMTELTAGYKNDNCDSCKAMNKTALDFTESNILNSCNDKDNCSLAAITVHQRTHTTILKLTYSCKTKGSSTTSNASRTTSNAISPTSNASRTTSNASRTTSNASSATPNASRTTSNASSPTSNASRTTSNASSPTSNANRTTSNASSPTSNASSPTSNARRTTSNESSATPNVSTTASNVSSTTLASLSNESTELQFSRDSDDPFPAAIVVSVIVPVIIVVLVVAFLMYRRDQCKLLLGKCTKGNRKYSHDRNDALVMGSTANANPTYHLSSVVDVNNYNEDYSVIDKVDKENLCEYNQVNFNRKQRVVQDLPYNHIGHFYRSSEDTEHTYNHVGDETSQKSDWSTLQPDTYSHVGAMARPASGHLAEDSYAHINGVNKDLPTAYKMNQYDCTVFQINGGQTGNSGHRGNEIKSGKENKFIVVGPSKVDMNSDASVSHSYFVLEKT